MSRRILLFLFFIFTLTVLSNVKLYPSTHNYRTHDCHITAVFIFYHKKIFALYYHEPRANDAKVGSIMKVKVSGNQQWHPQKLKSGIQNLSSQILNVFNETGGTLRKISYIDITS